MKNSSPGKALLFFCAFMLVFALVFQGLPPIFKLIINSLGITHAQAGALMSLFALPGILISIPSGILADIYGSKYVGTIALVIALLGSLMVGLANSYGALVIGRIVSGVGALTIAVVAPQALTKWFTKKDMGKVMGIFNMVMPLATVFTLNVFGRLANASNWRLPLILVSTYCLVVLILFHFKYPSEPTKNITKSKPDFTASLAAIKKTGVQIWLVAAIWMMYNAASISYLSFGGDYFVSVGYDMSYAGFLTSLLMIGSLILSPAVGFLTDKYGKAEQFLILSSVTLAFLLWLVPRTNLNPLLMGSLIGIVAPFIPAPVFALVPKFLPPEQVGLGYGILSTCLNVGVLIGPYLIGLSYDTTLNYVIGFNLMAIFSLLTAAIAIVLWLSTQIKHQCSTKRK